MLRSLRFRSISLSATLLLGACSQAPANVIVNPPVITVIIGGDAGSPDAIKPTGCTSGATCAASLEDFECRANELICKCGEYRTVDEAKKITDCASLEAGVPETSVDATPEAPGPQLKVSLASDTPVAGTLWRDQAHVSVVKFNFEAIGANQTIEGLKVTRFGLMGSWADVKSVALWNDALGFLTSCVYTSAVANCSGFSYAVTPGTKGSLSLVVDFDATGAGDHVFALQGAADVTLKAPAGVVMGAFPVSGNHFSVVNESNIQLTAALGSTPISVKSCQKGATLFVYSLTNAEDELGIFAQHFVLESTGPGGGYVVSSNDPYFNNVKLVSLASGLSLTPPMLLADPLGSPLTTTSVVLDYSKSGEFLHFAPEQHKLVAVQADTACYELKKGEFFGKSYRVTLKAMGSYDVFNDVDASWLEVARITPSTDIVGPTFVVNP